MNGVAEPKCHTLIQVSVKRAGGYNLMERHEFLAIPLEERIRLISSGQIQFLSDGAPVPLREGLQMLKEAGG